MYLIQKLRKGVDCDREDTRKLFERKCSYSSGKIKIEDNLDEVTKEVERLGYLKEGLFPFEECLFVEFYDDGYHNIAPYDDIDIDLITLTELKGMR